MKIKMKSCPLCGNGKIEKQHGELTFKHKRKKFKVSGIDYFYCHKCKEILTDIENEVKIDNALGTKKHVA